MNDLRAILDTLETAHLEYVIARSRTTTDAAAYGEIGVAKSTFYTWENRENLNALADQLKRQRALKAMLLLEESAEHAAQVKVGGLDSADEKIKQGVATEILDRTIGKPIQRNDLTTGGEKLPAAQVTVYIPDNGRADTEADA